MRRFTFALSALVVTCTISGSAMAKGKKHHGSFHKASFGHSSYNYNASYTKHCYTPSYSSYCAPKHCYTPSYSSYCEPICYKPSYCWEPCYSNYYGCKIYYDTSHCVYYKYVPTRRCYEICDYHQ